MQLSRRSSVIFAATASALVAAAIPQAAAGQPLGHRTPQFVATAVKFKALHETHYNWMGSDEVYAVFSDLDPTHDDSLTSNFGDVDAGESRDFAPDQNCIAPHPRCDQGLTDLHFKLALWEHDGSLFPFPHGQLTGGHTYLEKGVNSEDDLIGRAEVTMTRDQLLTALPHVGDSVDVAVIPTGGDGRYEVTYRLTRLADRFSIPPIGPPVMVNAITLQATAIAGRQVHLTWSGATTANVDIFRNGTKVTTTANDGDHVTPAIPPGTYQYRVCEFNSTTACSADVTVVVN